jgi:hypothetical protein
MEHRLKGTGAPGIGAPENWSLSYCKRIVMKSNALAAASLCCGIGLSTPASAMDAACQPLVQSQMKMANTPVHIFMTESRTWSKSLSRATAGMGMSGAKTSEEISTGKAVYVLNRGKWIDMGASLAGMHGDPNDPEVKKTQAANRCKALPDDAVAGQAAAVYEQHNPELGIDTKIWISKSRHLPLRSEITNKAGGPAMTSVTVSTYDYNNVRAPVGAISMQQMMNARRH